MAKKNQNPDKSGKVAAPANSTSSVRPPVVEQKVYDKILTSDEKKELLEKFQPNGDFEKDFLELCVLVDFPTLYIALRPKHLYSSISTTVADVSVNKNKEDKKLLQSQDITAGSLALASDKTKKLKLEINVEDEGGKRIIKEIYVRGWKVDKKFITILTVTMPDLEKINLIDLWNAGLDDQTLQDLARCLSAATSLRTLRLDGNSDVKNQRFDAFITEKSVLQNISLRNCSLDDAAAKFISDALFLNKSLLTLNLCFNKITDIGTFYLAKALRMNRSLLSLDLASNKISDDGAKNISEALSMFSLSHDQVVARRMLLSTFTSDDLMISPSHSITNEHDQSSSRSFSKQDDKKKMKKKDPINTNKLKDPIKRGLSSIDASKYQKGSKNKSSKQDHLAKTSQPDAEDLYDFKNPLLEKVKDINGELWIPGNRSLIILNLARNKITEVGLVSLLEAIKCQNSIAQEMNKTVPIGLMRLSLQGNSFDINHQHYLCLQQLMKSRDPFYVQTTGETKDS